MINYEKKLKARFIGPKQYDGRYYDLTPNKIYEGYLGELNEFIIYSDDIGEENYLDEYEFVIINEHDDTTHIHKCVHNDKRKYVIINL